MKRLMEGEKIFEKFHVSPMQPENEEIGPIERHKSITRMGMLIMKYIVGMSKNISAMGRRKT